MATNLPNVTRYNCHRKRYDDDHFCESFVSCFVWLRDLLSFDRYFRWSNRGTVIRFEILGVGMKKLTNVHTHNTVCGVLSTLAITPSWAIAVRFPPMILHIHPNIPLRNLVVLPTKETRNEREWEQVDSLATRDPWALLLRQMVLLRLNLLLRSLQIQEAWQRLWIF